MARQVLDVVEEPRVPAVDLELAVRPIGVADIDLETIESKRPHSVDA